MRARDRRRAHARRRTRLQRARARCCLCQDARGLRQPVPADLARPAAQREGRVERQRSTSCASSAPGCVALCADAELLGELRSGLSAIGCTRCSRATAAPTTCRAKPALRARAARARRPARRRDRGALPLARAPPAAGRADLHPPRRHARDRRPRCIRGNDEHDLARAARVRARCSPTSPPRSRARSRSPRAARSRSASCAIAIRRERLPDGTTSARVPARARRSTGAARRYGGDVPAERARAARRASSR